MQSQHFIFDDIESRDMDLQIVRMDQFDFINVPFWGEREIEERVHRAKISPYHYGITESPISFDLQLALVDKTNQVKKWTKKARRKIANWLIHNEYKPFISYDDIGKDEEGNRVINRMFYGIFIGRSNLNLINNEGYMELTFRTNSPYAWMEPEVKKFNLPNKQNSIIEIKNKSNVIKKYRPKIEIQLLNGETDVVLRNISNKNKEFKFEGLFPNEIISIDNENELILSNKFGSNPLKKFNREWLELIQGNNKIEVEGSCRIVIKYQFPIIQ